ncbi:transporter substrate-binding domain-containing protein [Vibrio europaeus]|uniref:Transporter substrate-binding domain-containing protein n=1 Tax=Vibrio europaeus TaxID=300876 RepID=A0A178J852_9VIBR|nr:transporter substrate-binding domain-containing protein [Vibrio europaeus]MDC5704908.1 transporter substrate-binding domain-containing protein [Vibrio europaeus]MDC5710187.1 transporter substrate-binding domain-containing protein [Vibrio europaeus]MDC5715277.1 transporter substrate-binding domain-containing protein [Vibrio europaeus]MDC5724674.1 transporter substrate-binding domain-containing protein [Vibrio europaeus]MDC5728629.1 transporter substrate-binding domain-containing protein [Vib
MKLRWLLTSGIAYASSTYAAPIPVTIYTDEGVPPYSYQEEGNAVGIYPELVRSIARKMPDFDITIEAVPWDRGLKLLEFGKGFALIPPYYLPKARPFIDPYSEPLMEEEVTVYCHKDIADEIDTDSGWPASFFGRRIGINSGYNIGGEALWVAEKNLDIKIFRGRDTEENLLKLQARRIDCYLHISLSIEWNAKSLNRLGKIDNLSWLIRVLKVSSQFAYVGYTAIDDQFPFKQRFIEEFDVLLIEHQETGQLDEIIRKYSN